MNKDYNESDELLDIGAAAYREGNYQKAQEYYEKSANLHNAQAACNLGYIYEYGRTGEKDTEKAFYYYSEAALLGNANAFYKVGDSYLYGNFVAKNGNLAFLNYMQAAGFAEDSGTDEDIKSDIYYRIAVCYFNGIGTEKDNLTALMYINRAESYAYFDRQNNKFMWRSIMKRIKALREKILREIED
ncbi:TPR repeat protein [Lactobacillus colini]|uniref:TPR repeat protein n=1 Tax=Lactobacillus colini TaxID=1819254 RepID=A0ABS4MB31_9LACO|nr:tetratricopeptide repeat protein [Lactobacillus colini]MBP2056873.1 TPR repeat protein [Lactobacillus colini]